MLTPAEKVFIERMAPHVMEGKSIEEAAAAVIADDERIWFATTERSDAGEAIRAELCAAVYKKARQPL